MLVAVNSGQAELSSTWWAMMQAHHRLGGGPLCGAQLRYLVACEAGFVGALSFSAPAWRLAPRDAWIHAIQGTIKDLWVYPLQSNWQSVLQANGGAATPH